MTGGFLVLSLSEVGALRFEGGQQFPYDLPGNCAVGHWRREGCESNPHITKADNYQWPWCCRWDTRPPQWPRQYRCWWPTTRRPETRRRWRKGSQKESKALQGRTPS